MRPTFTLRDAWRLWRFLRRARIEHLTIYRFTGSWKIIEGTPVLSQGERRLLWEHPGEASFGRALAHRGPGWSWEAMEAAEGRFLAEAEAAAAQRDREIFAALGETAAGD